MRKILIKFFDKLEDKIRVRLSRRAVLYALIGGVSTVLFWRGVWMTADKIENSGGLMGILFSGPVSLVASIVFLLATGLFVSVFIGEKIIISGLKKEKKIFDKTEQEIREEGGFILEMKLNMDKLKQDVAEIKDLIIGQKTKDK